METRQNLKALRTAVPYIRAYKGRVMVVKLGGQLCAPGEVLLNIVDQVGVLYQLGIRVVLVHGGGEQADALAARLSLTPRRVAGRRVTDAPMLDVMKMALAGTVQTDVLAAFRRACVPAVGLSGVDAGLVAVHRRPPRATTDPSTGVTETIDFGFVGDIDAVRADPLEHVLNGGFVPVVCSLAADNAGQVYNINADTVAARIAVAMSAAKYFAVTTVDGVLADVNDRSTLQSYLDIAELERLIAAGRIGGGMLPKLASCIDALRGGVTRVHVVNGTVPDTILAEIFTNEGCGTLIVAERARAGDVVTGAAPPAP